MQESGLAARNLPELHVMQSVERILLVEVDDVARGRLEAAAASLGHVESHGRFENARARLFSERFDLLVTNVRLGAYNGLHLVYLTSHEQGAPRAIVYSEKRDLGLAREVQQAGAFYEVGTCLPVTLGAYVKGELPDHDRRDPATPDRRRRAGPGGGRRCWDMHLKTAPAQLTSNRVACNSY
jgi:DNA-binding NtrC family response regulator